VFEYETKEIDEKKLEDMVRQAPHLIEEGLRFVDQQRRAGRGPLDVLFVDSGNALVVAELKAHPDDGMLMQALDYYDNVSLNLDRIGRAYSRFSVDAGQRPRLMLIAPGFSQTLISRCKWIDDELKLSIFAYKYIVAKERKQDTLVFIEMEIAARPEVGEEPTLDGLLSYIKNERMRTLAKQLFEDVRAWNPDAVVVRSRKGYAPVLVSGKKFADWAPVRQAWRVWTWDDDGNWKMFSVNDELDYPPLLEALRSSFAKVGGEFLAEKPG
jgi:hypothetical protein